MVPASGRCVHHPQRAGIGLCVLCRRTVCAECTTQYDGINRCADCLKTLRTQEVTATAVAPEWGAGNLLLVLVFFALASLTALAGSYLLSP